MTTEAAQLGGARPAEDPGDLRMQALAVLEAPLTSTTSHPEMPAACAPSLPSGTPSSSAITAVFFAGPSPEGVIGDLTACSAAESFSEREEEIPPPVMSSPALEHAPPRSARRSSVASCMIRWVLGLLATAWCHAGMDAGVSLLPGSSFLHGGVRGGLATC